MDSLAAAAVEYLTNHLISAIPSHSVRAAWYRRVLGWYLGPHTTILMGQRVRLRHIRRNGVRTSIGAGTHIEADGVLSTMGGLLIGEHVWISRGVWLITCSQDLDDPQFTEICDPIVIDNYAWIGARAIILGGVTIGTGAVVQPGAVVTQDVAPQSVVEGVPAKAVGTVHMRKPSYTLYERPLFE